MARNSSSTASKPSSREHDAAVAAWDAKRQAKIDKAEKYAAKNKAEAEALWKRSGDMLPWGGEPVKVGHHSEKRHRNMLSRSDNMSRKSIQKSKTAEYWERKAKRVKNDKSIRTGDPNAVKKLRDKVAKLTADQNHMKTVNKAYKAYKKNPASISKYKLTPQQHKQVTSHVAKDYFTKTPYMSASITNNGATIRQTNERLHEMSGGKHGKAPKRKTYDFS